MQTLFVLALLLSFLHESLSFYLPGDLPPTFMKKGDLLEVKVNKLSSIKAQLSYDYYSLSYCKPPVTVNTSLSLRELSRGDRIKDSVYNFKFREDEYCKIACRVKLDEASAKNFKAKINDKYKVIMILDNLPAAIVHHKYKAQDGDGKSTIYVPGIPVGVRSFDKGGNKRSHTICNHLRFKVIYHEDPKTDYASIVGFEVEPHSINHLYKEWDDEKTKLATCKPISKQFSGVRNVPQEVDTNREVVFTYDVSFVPSDIKWSSRWEAYLYRDDSVHWSSMLRSLMLVLFLSGLVAIRVMRTLYMDITSYNQLVIDEASEIQSGWKLVHGDVFRPPLNSSLLCVCVGSGVQVFGMTLVMMIFGLLGFLSPQNQGGLNTKMVLLWMLMGIFSGYSSARLYKMFKGTEWKKMALLTALTFPAICFGMIFMMNILLWRENSCGTVPFGTMFALVLMWFAISVPLVFIGSYVGFIRPAIEDPVKTSEIPRQIPKRSILQNIKWYVVVFSGGYLSYASLFVEFFFILISLWLDQFYYYFGYLFLVFIIFLVTCSEVAIVLCFLKLRSEDYHWWWRAYSIAGFSTLQMFSYSAYFFFTRMWIGKFVSAFLYFGYMLVLSFAFFLLTGTIGFCTCFWFVRKIYSSVKFD